MLVTPERFRMPMARFRQAVIARGALPVRSWDVSSAKVVSRTWCRDSMLQWPRTSFASWAGAAWWAVRLVTA